MRVCSAEGCERPQKSRGLCSAHYEYQRKNRDVRISPPRFCIVEGCGKAFFAREYCAMHYTRLRLYGDVERSRGKGSLPRDEREYLAENVDTSPGQGPNGDCHEWTGARMAHGYGRFRLSGRGRAASRMALVLATGEDPPDKAACHTCDNPPCCSEEHLFWGTQPDNLAGMRAKGRGWWQRKGASDAVPA